VQACRPTYHNGAAAGVARDKYVDASSSSSSRMIFRDTLTPAATLSTRLAPFARLQSLMVSLYTPPYTAYILSAGVGTLRRVASVSGMRRPRVIRPESIAEWRPPTRLGKFYDWVGPSEEGDFLTSTEMVLFPSGQPFVLRHGQVPIWT